MDVNDKTGTTTEKVKGVIDLRWLNDDAYIDETALASAIGKTDRTVRRMINRGELPQPFLFAGRRQWRGGDVKDHIDRLATAAQEGRAKMDAERAKIRAKNTVL